MKIGDKVKMTKNCTIHNDNGKLLRDVVKDTVGTIEAMPYGLDAFWPYYVRFPGCEKEGLHSEGLEDSLVGLICLDETEMEVVDDTQGM